MAWPSTDSGPESVFANVTDAPPASMLDHELALPVFAGKRTLKVVSTAGEVPRA